MQVGETMSKKRKLITSAIFSAVLSLVVAFVFCVTDVFSVRQQTKVQPFFDAEIIAVNENEQNYASLFKNFDKLEIEQEDETQRVVSSVMTMYGSNLDNIQYTSTGQDEEVIITGQTVINKITNEGQVDLTFDFGDFQEYINASSNLYYDEEGNLQGTVLFDGQEYDVQEVLAMMSTDGVQECWFWLLIKIVIVVVQVAVVAHTAYNLYQYLTMEEVTVEGVLSIVCEGLVMSALGGLAGVVAKYAVKTGKSLFKAGKTKSKAKTENGKILTGLKGDISFDACIDTVKSGKRHIDISAESHYCNKKDYANDKSSIEAYYLTQYKKAGYSFRGGNGDKDLTIHHIVEQSQAPKKFANADIQTDLNTVAISPKLHQLISDFYNTGPSKNADLLNKLFPGKFDLKAGGKLRNQIYNMSYEDQYEVGTRILEHFLGQATVDKEKTCLRVSKIK